MKLVKGTFLFTAMAAVATFTAGAIWYSASLRAVDADNGDPVDFVLASGDGVNEVADKLEDSELIRSSTAFMTYVTLRGQRSNLQAGAYRLSRAMSVAEIADKLASGEVDLTRITIPEGFTMSQIGGLMLGAGRPREEVEAALTAAYSAEFLKARPAGTSLEGYLFPDTYLFPKTAKSQDMVILMLETFAKRVDQSLIASFEKQGLNLHQAVTLASIVEKEARRAEDRPVVAQVFLRRLKIGMKLDSDVTVQYGAGLEPTDQVGTAKAIQTSDSPYNTYRRAGLPPGPIGSPGLASLRAVAQPATSDYLYFVADKQGVTHFARTAEEHQKNIETYLR